MATRTVEVLLRLVTGQYRREANDAADATDKLDRSVDKTDRDLKKIPADAAAAAAATKVLGRGAEDAADAVDDLDQAIKDADGELKKVPPDAAKAAAALKLLGSDADTAGVAFATLGDKSATLTVLDTKIRATRDEVRKLGAEFVKTGDVDVWRKLGESDAALRRLEQVRKKVADAVIPDKQVEGFFKRLVSRAEGAAASLSDSLGKAIPSALSGALGTPVIGPIIAAAGLVIGLILADTIAATIGGAILGAGGLAGVGVGIIGGIMGDPVVIGAAWSSQIDMLMARFLAASTVFRGPLLDAALEFGGVINSVDLDGILARAATYMGPLVAGAAGFARHVGVGFGGLVDAAGPVMRVIAAELPKLGMAVRSAMTDIGGGSEGGARALQDLLQITQRVIVAVGAFIGVAEKLYSKLADFRDFVLPHDWFLTPDLAANLNTAGRALRKVGDNALLSADDLKALDSQLGQTAITADTLAAKMVDKIFTATMNLDQALLGVAESLTRLDETMDKNGHTIDIYTSKGQANREAILASVTANMQLYQAQISAGMASGDAAAAYDQNTAALEAQLRKAGLLQPEIDGLIGKYRGVPKKVDTDIAMHGLTDAIDRLNETIRLVNGLKNKDVYVTYHYKIAGQSLNAPMAKGGVRRAAIGMVIPPSDPGTTLVGEPQTGGEVLTPLRGITRGRAMQLSQVAGNAHGFDVVPRDYRGYRSFAASPGMWAGGAGGSATPAGGAGSPPAPAMDMQTLTRAFVAALHGTGVYLDNFMVGQLLGRQADLLRRGG